MTTRVTVGITTRNRAASLRRCLQSLSLVRETIAEVLVFDDGSSPPAAVSVPADLPFSIEILRDEAAPGNIVGRNRLVERASQPLVLLLDDDAMLVDGEALALALRVIAGDRAVAAIAFAQAEQDGRPWPARMQPATATVPAKVRSFIGFAHLVRRDVFRALGGYRELFGYYGEEKELSLRLLDAGYSVVYLPDARVAHIPDAAGRDPRRYLRAVTKNDCLGTLLNEPFWRAAWLLPGRLFLYFRMRRAWRVRDPWGFWWIVGQLWHAAPELRRQRRPVRWATVRRWQALGVKGEPYAT